MILLQNRDEIICPMLWYSNWTDKKFSLSCKECTDLEYQCTRNCFAAGLRPDPLGELTELPQTP